MKIFPGGMVIGNDNVHGMIMNQLGTIEKITRTKEIKTSQKFWGIVNVDSETTMKGRIAVERKSMFQDHWWDIISWNEVPGSEQSMNSAKMKKLIL